MANLDLHIHGLCPCFPVLVALDDVVVELRECAEPILHAVELEQLSLQECWRTALGQLADVIDEQLLAEGGEAVLHYLLLRLLPASCPLAPYHSLLFWC